MYKYQLSQDNPEGIDFVIDLVHEQLYKPDEFSKLMENAICKTFEDMLLVPNITIFRSYLNEELLFKNLALLGFRISNDIPVARYCYSPFDENCDTAELTAMLDKLDVIRSERQAKKRAERKNSE
jgi:hypothetical protein